MNTRSNIGIAERQENVAISMLLFEYALKCLLLSAFLELVLYRLVSRLGMHLSKIAAKYEVVKLAFETIASLGFMLLNLTALLAFLLLFLLLYQKVRKTHWVGKYDKVLVPSVSLLIVVTVAYLVFPPAMAGSVIYNVLTFVVLLVLVMEFMATHHVLAQRLLVGTFFLGISSWLYYQTVSTGYGMMNITTPPPLVHEVNRIGEALMVLASLLTFWAYGSTSFFSKNKQQRRWALTLLVSGGALFGLLLFLDYILMLIDPAMAREVRKAGEGIGWIFQMGMGYTFYLPFAFYVAGLIAWGYTVIKLIIIGRLAGYGLGLMFMAGYALQLSHLTLMVVLGLLLLTLDKQGTLGRIREKVTEAMTLAPTDSMLTHSTR